MTAPSRRRGHAGDPADRGLVGDAQDEVAGARQVGDQPDRLADRDVGDVVIAGRVGILGWGAAGLGVTLVPRAVADPALRAGRVSVHPVPDGDGHAPTLLVHRADDRASAAFAVRRGGPNSLAGLAAGFALRLPIPARTVPSTTAG